MRFPQVKIAIDMPQQRFAGQMSRHDALSSAALDNSGAPRIEATSDWIGLSSPVNKRDEKMNCLPMCGGLGGGFGHSYFIARGKRWARCGIKTGA